MRSMGSPVFHDGAVRGVPQRGYMSRAVLRSRTPKLLGIGALFSGAALVTHILTGVSLRLGLAAAGGLLLLGLGSLWKRSSSDQRFWLGRRAKVGVLAGLAATAGYDTSRFVLSQFETAPYNPFEVIRVFGTLLAGSSAPSTPMWIAGTSFHVLNGTGFGAAFSLLFKSHGVLKGTAWGLFLELFQLTLYPGWLDIRFYREFMQISVCAHIVYGALLGHLCRQGLRREVRLVERRR